VGDPKFTTIAGIQTEFNTLIAANNTVKFIGTRTGWNATLTLNIPANKTAAWTATITGLSSAGVLITLNGGTGNLNITGGTITHTSNSSPAVRNSSVGTITVSGDAYIKSSANSLNGTIDNATIVATGIGTVNIIGGKVENTVNQAINNMYNNVLNISGGLVTSPANANDIGTINNVGGGTGTINITGGIVENTGPASATNKAIHNTATGTVNVTGGLVIVRNAGSQTNAIRTATLTTGAVNVAYPWVGDPLVVPFPDNVIDVTAKTPAQISTEYTEKIAWFNTVNFTGINNNWNTQLELNIPANKTVEWSATISGTVAGSRLINVNGGTGNLNVTGGTITASGNCIAIFNNTAGTVTVSGNVTVTSNLSSTNQGTMSNYSTGAIIVTGSATVRNTATDGRVIHNNNTGAITIAENAVVTGIGSSSYPIIRNESTGIINIEGGTVTGTGASTAAINNVVGTVNISGGKVETTQSTSGAIYMGGAGTVNVSGGMVTSIVVGGTDLGTINNSGNGTVNVSGGTVQNTDNTNTNRRAIYNSNGGTTNVTGGLVQLTNPGSIDRAIRGGTINVTPPGVVIPWN